MASALAAWIATGRLPGDGPVTPVESVDSPQATVGVGKKGLQRVQVRELVAEKVPRQAILHGVTAPGRQLTLRSEIAGRVVSLAAKRGDDLDAGEVVVAIDRRDRDERLREAKALLKQRELEYRAAERLRSDGLRAESQLAEALTQLESARTVVRSIGIEIARLQVKAPFAGRIEELPVEIGAYLADGDPVAELIELDPLKVVATASELQVASLKHGQIGRVELVDGQQASAQVTFVAGMANPATRTFVVELTLSNRNHTLPSGVTAVVDIETGETSAHAVSPALLTLDDRGEAGLMVVDEQDRARFMPARMVKSTTRLVWLEGLPERLRVIVVGQGFVHDGQQVEVVAWQEPA
jgi:multidrug efflux system membrane fusion protein